MLRTDYALFYKANIPLAVVEAKDNHHAVGACMAQAINYATLLDVPFSLTSNGDGFVFRDATAGQRCAGATMFAAWWSVTTPPAKSLATTSSTPSTAP